MRIAIVVNAFPLTSQTFVIAHAAGLAARGHEVVIVPERPETRSDTHQDGVVLESHVIRSPAVPSRRIHKIIEIPAQRAMWQGRAALRVAQESELFGIAPTWRPTMRRLYWARRLMAAGHVDLVHSHFGPCAVFAATARRHGLTPVPVIATVHGADVTALPRQYGRDVYRPTFQGLDAITVGSRYIASVVHDLGG